MPEQQPVVVLETDRGTIRIALDVERAPESVANFLDYVSAGHYDGLIFHRVIPGFMIQGGGMDADMKERPTRGPIKNEANNGLPNRRGTIAMARTGVVDSATSQFFINVADNKFLNHSNPSPSGYGYAVFGEVIDGMDVVDAIVALPTGRRGAHDDVPLEPVVIRSARVEPGAP
jgi:peptidyl-prolyl cis-trans isomerase B (cyclophilin B)